MNVSHGYELYMQSPEWAATRKRKLQHVGYKCQGCDSTERLQVHHLTYERFGHERDTDLQVLCHLCHAKEHGLTPDIGPIAGPTVSDLGEPIKTREARDRRQADIAAMVPILKTWAELKPLLESLMSGAIRRRVKSIDRELGKLLAEAGT